MREWQLTRIWLSSTIYYLLNFLFFLLFFGMLYSDCKTILRLLFWQSWFRSFPNIPVVLYRILFDLLFRELSRRIRWLILIQWHKNRWRIGRLNIAVWILRQVTADSEAVARLRFQRKFVPVLTFGVFIFRMICCNVSSCQAPFNLTPNPSPKIRRGA